MLRAGGHYPQIPEAIRSCMPSTVTSGMDTTSDDASGYGTYAIGNAQEYFLDLRSMYRLT